MTSSPNSRLMAALAALIVLAVVWDRFTSHSGRSRAHTGPDEVVVVESGPPATAPPAGRASQGTSSPSAAADSSGGPSYLELLARSETRRRLRAAGGVTYLNEIVAESQDSALHRWSDRALDPVRVYLRPGTVANYRPEFSDAIRTAFQQWQQTGVPVAFDLDADSSRAEVVFRWKIQFEIDRTGQTDLEWDQDGHITHATVTIATFDPKGKPLEPDDVRAIALHEIGHVLGLDHSPDSTDLMYARGAVRQFSDRDVRTALLLYQLTPGSVR